MNKFKLKNKNKKKRVISHTHRNKQNAQKKQFFKILTAGCQQ